jgi:preprotein translocase subunit SecY
LFEFKVFNQNRTIDENTSKIIVTNLMLFVFFLGSVVSINAQATLENEIKISDFGLHFNGSRVARKNG